MTSLHGQVAVITGGARGQGRSHAVAIAAAGADVVLCDIASDIATVPYPLGTTDELKETVQLVEAQGRRCLGIVADMRHTDQVDGVFADAIREFGKIDILIANHGVVTYGQIEDTSDEEWSNVLDTNLTGIFKTLRSVIPHMRAQRYGRIIAISSHAARRGTGHLSAYTASKWGIVGLVKSCALEVAQYGITVNAVCPASVDTIMTMNDPTYRLFCPDLESPTREDFERRARDEFGPGYFSPAAVTRTIMHILGDEEGVLNGQVHDLAMGRMSTMPT